MSSARRIVIVGAGPAGVGAALAARAQDPAAEILLITDELCEPYEKPPLSKAVLTRKAMPHEAPIAGPGGVGGHKVTLKTGTRCSAIDRAGRAAVTDEGERIPYDALVLATGSINRVLPLFPAGHPGIHYLRTQREALGLREQLTRSRSLLVVGAGLIGLEVAASAAELGVKTTVLEVAPRILVRVCDPETSALVQAHHAAHGVDIRLGTTISAVRTLPDGRTAIATQGGETLTADLVVVGTGVVPDDRLAQAAGLDVQDGIMVDDHGFTSDRTVLAAGDCTRFAGPRGPVRLENWRHAQEQGAVAGRNAAGGDAVYNVTPSFWSEQYDLYIQGMGWPLLQPSAQVRRQIGPNAMLRFDLDGDHLAYVLGINAQRDIAAARRLIERRVPVDAAALADPGKPLAAMLKAKA
ncbi:MAG TPA: FAD-dependent oxidoreductase [Xanthobacteraceae bacterium]|jgi:NADPH-dependent 2,4-dienoyl-CoA reductase/sulfur reductase-like enzyme|nr:FAD-dependent oxidoreductase [Xanthobacteraceae bacterium]